MINLNDNLPASPVGGANVKWQEDASGNVSAYVGFGGGGGGGAKTIVAPVAGALTINAALGNSFKVNVNAAITSTTITNPTDGQEITILWVQDGTGHAIVLPTNMSGGTAPSTGAGLTSCQKFTYNVSNTWWYAVSAGVIGM